MRLKNRKKSAAAIKSMKVGTDELKDLIKGAVKEAMGEEDDTGDDGSDTAAALDGITAEDMADIIEQAVDNANEKRKSRKDAGEEVGDLTADEVIQEAAEIIDSMTADEGMDDDEADPEGKDDDEADSDEKDDDEAASEDDAKRRKSAAFRRQVKSGTAPAQRKYSSLFMGGTASAKKQQKSVPRWLTSPAPSSVWMSSAGMTRNVPSFTPRSTTTIRPWPTSSRPCLPPTRPLAAS